MKKYTYFFSFSASHETKPVFGNVVVDLDEAIKSKEDIYALHVALKNYPQFKDYSDLVVLWYTELD